MSLQEKGGKGGQKNANYAIHYTTTLTVQLAVAQMISSQASVTHWMVHFTLVMPLVAGTTPVSWNAREGEQQRVGAQL